MFPSFVFCWINLKSEVSVSVLPLLFSLSTFPELISLQFGNAVDVCNFSLAFKMQLCTHSRTSLLKSNLILIYIAVPTEAWSLGAGGLTRSSTAVLSSVRHARTCHAGYSVGTGTSSSWVFSCQFINLRSGSVSAQVIAGKAGDGGCWFCAHADFLQSLSSKLSHPGRWLEAKEP